MNLYTLALTAIVALLFILVERMFFIYITLRVDEKHIQFLRLAYGKRKVFEYLHSRYASELQVLSEQLEANEGMWTPYLLARYRALNQVRVFLPLLRIFVL